MAEIRISRLLGFEYFQSPMRMPVGPSPGLEGPMRDIVETHCTFTCRNFKARFFLAPQRLLREFSAQPQSNRRRVVDGHRQQGYTAP
jgi:hypothetical protein